MAAMHISALQLAEGAFIQCEADKIHRTDLKQKVYSRGDDIRCGHKTKRYGDLLR